MHFSSFNATQESILQLESLKLDFQILIRTNIVNASLSLVFLNFSIFIKSRVFVRKCNFNNRQKFKIIREYGCSKKLEKQQEQELGFYLLAECANELTKLQKRCVSLSYKFMHLQKQKRNTLHLLLILLSPYTDFKRDQLKVQVTSKLTLRLMGERLITENRWHRFNLELPLLFYYDTDSVTAKFKGAKLSIKFGELSQTKRKETLITPPSQKIEHQKPTLEDV